MSRRFFLLAALLLPLALPLAAAELTPPETLAGGRSVSGPLLLPSNAFYPLIASNGTSFFAAWTDGRFGEGDVLGARMDASGNLVDTDPITLVATWKWDYPGALVAGGDEYALFARTEMGGAIAARIEADGSVIGGGLVPNAIPLDGAWNGSRYAIASASPNEEPLRLLFFDRELNPQETVSIGEPNNTLPAAVVAAGNGRFLVVWQHEDLTAQTMRLRAQLFDDRGNPFSPPHELASSSTSYSTRHSMAPAVSWNGTSFVVIWSWQQSIRGTVVSPSGEPGKTFAIAADLQQSAQAIAWDGRIHLVVWQESGTHEAATVTSGGEVIERFSLGKLPAAKPILASNGEMFLMIASSRRIAVRPTSPERVTDLGPLTYAYQPQSDPVITAGASHLLTAWFEGGSVYASRIATTGARIGEPLRLGPGENYGLSGSVTAASAGDVHLVAWRDSASNRPHVVKVSADGIVAPVSGLSPGSSPSAFLAASNGTDFGLVWSEPATPPAYYSSTLMFGGIGSDGSVIVKPIGTGAYGVRTQVVKWTGNAYAVFWRNVTLASARNPSYEDHLTVVTQSGVVTSDVVVPTRNMVASTIDERGLFVVAYASRPDGTLAVSTQRFGFDGSASPAVALPDRTAWPIRPRLVRTADGYTMIGTFYVGTTGEWNRLVMHFSDAGELIQETTRTDGTTISDAIHAFGGIWTTFVGPWVPLPEAHGGSVWRAFYEALSPRARAIRRR